MRCRKYFRLAASCLAGAFGLAFLFVGLPPAALAAVGRVTVISGGVPRTAILVQHRRLKQARRPAIVMLRSHREKGGRLKRTLGFEELARSSGVVLIYPEPLAGRWEIGHGPETARDTVFIRDLIAKLITRGIANRNKIFLVGIRSGGMMALRLACEDKNIFAGVAIVGASLPSDLEAFCKPSRPIPLMMVAGTADPALPYHGGTAALPNGTVSVLPVEATLGLFGKAAGCTGGMTSSLLPAKDSRHAARAYLDKLNGCAVPIEAVRIEGPAPPLPGALGEAGVWHGLTIGGVSGAKFVWDFLRQLGG